MANYITLSCPTCGGQLGITDDINRFACTHCGPEHLVKRALGIEAIEPIVHGLEEIQPGTDRTASELAIRRLKGDIADYNRQIEKLAEDILRQDFGNELMRLYGEKRLTFIDGMKLNKNDPDHIDRVVKLYKEINDIDLQVLIDNYWNGVLLKTNKKKEIFYKLKKISVLKLKNTEIQQEINKHVDILSTELKAMLKLVARRTSNRRIR